MLSMFGTANFLNITILPISGALRFDMANFYDADVYKIGGEVDAGGSAREALYIISDAVNLTIWAHPCAMLRA